MPLLDPILNRFSGAPSQHTCRLVPPQSKLTPHFGSVAPYHRGAEVLSKLALTHSTTPTSIIYLGYDSSSLKSPLLFIFVLF